LWSGSKDSTIKLWKQSKGKQHKTIEEKADEGDSGEGYGDEEDDEIDFSSPRDTPSSRRRGPKVSSHLTAPSTPTRKKKYKGL